MQVILLAAGESSRFYPFNNYSHKSMVAILGKPIIVYTIESIKKSGITDIIVVTPPSDEIRLTLGSGKKFGVSIRYVVQKNPEGMGDALLRCSEFIKNDFFVAHSFHLDFDSFAQDLLDVKKENVKSVLLAKKKTGIMQGVLEFKDKKVLGIVEKPKKGTEPSNLSIVGIYLFEKSFLDTLSEVPQEHYMFEKAISNFAKENYVTFVNAAKVTVSLKYTWDLLKIKDFLLKRIKRSISGKADIAKSAEIIGDVIVENGASIMENAVIKGPCYIGKNTFIGNNAILRGGIDVEENAVVGANMEIKNSILMQDSTTHSGYIGDSVIGKNCKIAAGFFTANVRLDRASVKAIVKEEKVETGLKFFGATIGNNADIGIRVSTMPGVVIGRNVTVGPSTVVMGNVPDDTKYYTKFAGIVSKKKPVVLFDIDYTLFDTAFFKESNLLKHKAYEEVIKVLESLNKVAMLGIFSKGETEFQRTKLRKTGMMKFFKENNIHIFDDKDVNLINVLEKYKDSQVFLVDDKLGILYSAKKHMVQIFTVWVRRGPFAQKQKEIPGFKPNAEVENLEEVVKIIKNSLEINN